MRKALKLQNPRGTAGDRPSGPGARALSAHTGAPPRRPPARPCPALLSGRTPWRLRLPADLRERTLPRTPFSWGCPTVTLGAGARAAGSPPPEGRAAGLRAGGVPATWRPQTVCSAVFFCKERGVSGFPTERGPCRLPAPEGT